MWAYVNMEHCLNKDASLREAKRWPKIQLAIIITLRPEAKTRLWLTAQRLYAHANKITQRKKKTKNSKLLSNRLLCTHDQISWNQNHNLLSNSAYWLHHFYARAMEVSCQLINGVINKKESQWTVADRKTGEQNNI